MFYNTAAYKKAGLDPQKPARTWSTLQGELLKLRDVADIDCPLCLQRPGRGAP